MFKNNSSNPMFAPESFRRGLTSAHSMSVAGTAGKTLILMLMVVATSFYSYNLASEGFLTLPVVIGAAIIALIAAIVARSMPKAAPIAAPIYAAVEGILVGGISALYAHLYDGIIFQAVVATFGVVLAALILYATRIVKVTKGFTKVVMIATLGIFFIYLLNMVLALFGINMPYLHEATPIGIGISVVIVFVAALNLFLDFNEIETGARMGLSKNYEWVAAIGLLVTIVWLYFEILRLISLVTSRD